MRIKKLVWMSVPPMLFLFGLLIIQLRESKESRPVAVHTARKDDDSRRIVQPEQAMPSRPNTVKPKRLYYRHSVISGGIETPDELGRAISGDRVIAAHFVDFNVAKSQTIKLPSSKSAYVSYRVGNKIYWTRKKIKLTKGETLVTDGANYVRTRCGNRISEVLRSPNLPEDPSQQVLDTPVPLEEMNLPASLPPLSVPPPTYLVHKADYPLPIIPPPQGNFFPPILIPVIGGGGAIATRVRPGTVAVPEPSTFVLIGTGLAGFLAYRKKLRK